MKPLRRQRRLPGLAACLLVCLSLVACGPDVPHAKSLERKELMRLVFPGWSEKGTKAIQTVSLPESSDGQGKRVDTPAQISPIQSVRLDDSHADLLTRNAMVDTDMQPAQCHACSVGLGAYFFAKDGKGWRLEAREDNAASIGVAGNMGDVRVERVNDVFVFFAHWGSCWQGYCGSWLETVGLWPGKARPLSPAIRLSAENSGAVGECGDTYDADAGSSAACFDVRGKWAIRKGQVVIDFKGETRDAPEGERRPPARRIAAQARYALQGETLKLVEGKNPVPEF